MSGSDHPFDERSVTEMLNEPDTPFKRCDSCGRVHLRKYAHACEKADETATRPSEAFDSETLRTMDEGDLNEVVYISPNTRSHQRYHVRVGTNETPARCSAHLRCGDAEKWKPVTRSEAFARGCRPCLLCYRIGVELTDPNE